MEHLIVTKSEEIQYNWGSQCQGSPSLHVIDDSCNYPKHLLIQAYKELQRWAKDYHIDISFYPYVWITKWDCTYSIMFSQIANKSCPAIQMQEIYYDSKNKKLLQWCVNLT